MQDGIAAESIAVSAARTSAATAAVLSRVAANARSRGRRAGFRTLPGVLFAIHSLHLLPLLCVACVSFTPAMHTMQCDAPLQAAGRSHSVINQLSYTSCFCSCRLAAPVWYHQAGNGTAQHDDHAWHRLVNFTWSVAKRALTWL